VAASIEVLMSFEAWDQLRTAQELSIDDAADVVGRAVLVLLGQQPDGKREPR
jgi:hypothetical protein